MVKHILINYNRFINIDYDPPKRKDHQVDKEHHHFLNLKLIYYKKFKFKMIS